MESMTPSHAGLLFKYVALLLFHGLLLGSYTARSHVLQKVRRLPKDRPLQIISLCFKWVDCQQNRRKLSLSLHGQLEVHRFIWHLLCDKNNMVRHFKYSISFNSHCNAAGKIRKSRFGDTWLIFCLPWPGWDPVFCVPVVLLLVVLGVLTINCNRLLYSC